MLISLFPKDFLSNRLNQLKGFHTIRSALMRSDERNDVKFQRFTKDTAFHRSAKRIATVTNGEDA